VTIDGHLAGEYVQIAETCCKEAISLKKRVHVFLRDVSTVDEDGRNLLSRLVASGCRLHASGTYNSYIVQTLQPVKGQRTNSTGKEAGRRR
jgi:ribosomal protein S13